MKLADPTYFRLPELYSSSEFLDLNEWHVILNMVREAVEQDPRFRIMPLSMSYRFLDLVTVSYLDWKRIKKEMNT